MMMQRIQFCFLLFSALVLSTVALGGKVAIQCDESEREKFSCTAGRIFNYENEVLQGTYMCREERKWIFGSEKRTICVPTFLDSVIGEAGDVCGCCGGSCPKSCSCPCGDEGEDVLMYTKGRFGFREETECVSKGKRGSKQVVY